MKKIITLVCFVCLAVASLMLFISADSGTGSAVSALRIESYPYNTVYGAFEQLDVRGLSLSATLTDGSVKRVMGDEIQVSYNRDECFRVGDETVTLSYGGKSIKLPVTVNRIAYDLSALELNSIRAVYNGKYQSYTELLPKIVGLDGIPLQMSAVGGSIDAGVYDISIDFYTDSKDYVTPESRVISMTVAPLEVEAVWDRLSFTYDGKSKTPKAYFTDLNGARVNLSVVGAATNAGQNYTATALLSDSNYKLKNPSANFEIKKADYDMSGVRWSSDSFVYDGSKKGVTISGLPVGVSVIGYSGDRATDVGKYTAIANLSWDEINYNSPTGAVHSWEILPAEYDMTDVKFDSASYVFDGQIHYPELKGSMPVGADGIPLEYSFSAGACHVSDGVVSVIISFSGRSKNYIIPPDRYSSVYITPKGIEVVWGGLNLPYNGEKQVPDAHSNKCSVRVSGEQIDAGKYSAFAITDDEDYYIINQTVDYTIEKAENLWIVQPRKSECYEGREISLIGKSKFGKVSYTFFSDRECKTEISAPVACGSYYAVITVSATENYNGLRSEPIPFDIVPIKPVSFMAVISTSKLSAFDKLLPTDIVCSVINNDGSSSSVDSSLVSITYESGDSFRRSDSSVTLKYGQFTLTLPVEIDYADYDLSNVGWKNTTVVYNGKEHTPTIIGLPNGVKLVRYVGGGVKDAGNYKVYAEIDYDTDNYNSPILPVCDFIIEKCPVSVPYIKAIYNGNGIVPESDSPLYNIISSGAYINSGKYAITVRLTDDKNYVFKENSQSSASAIFEIEPATICVKVSDVTLHLLEPLKEADYKIIYGSIFDGDILTTEVYREGRKIFIRSTNPNYLIVSEPGRLIRLPYPTVEGGIIIISTLIALVLIVLTTLLILRNRDRIAAITAMAECKRKNRGYKAPEPKAVEGIRTVADDEREKEILDKLSESIRLNESEADEFSEKYQILDFDVDAARADMLITDSLAKSLLKKEGDVIYTNGNSRGIINVDTLSESFSPGDRVDINSLKQKGLIDEQVSFIKVLARGRIDKPLIVYANDFSLSAVKMIALTGGRSIKTVTKHWREKG